MTEDELNHYARDKPTHLFRETDQALFCTFGGLTFGDIALVPAPFLKNPKGIRDIEEWYISTVYPPGLYKGGVHAMTRPKQAIGKSGQA